MREAKAVVNMFGVVVEFPQGQRINRDIYILLVSNSFVKRLGVNHYVNELPSAEVKAIADQAAALYNSGAPEKKYKIYPKKK